MRTTYPGLLLENATAGSRTRDLLSRRSKGLTTTPPDVIYIKKNKSVHSRT